MAKAQNAKAKKKGGNANRRNVWLLVLTTVLVLGSIFMFTPPQDKINQGLDIQGGLSVVLSAKSTDGDADDFRGHGEVARHHRAAASTRSVPPRPWCSCRAPTRSSCRSPAFPIRRRRCHTIGKTGKLEFARLDSFTDEDVKTKIENGQYGASSTITDDFGNKLPSGKTEHLTVEEGTYTPLDHRQRISRRSISASASETGDRLFGQHLP